MRVNKGPHAAPRWRATFRQHKDVDTRGDKSAYVYAWTHYGARLEAVRYARRRNWSQSHPYLTCERAHRIAAVVGLLKIAGGFFLVGAAGAVTFLLPRFDESTVVAFSAPQGVLQDYGFDPDPQSVPVYVYSDAYTYECVENCPKAEPTEGDPGFHCRLHGNRWCGGRWGEPR